jgi:hypothetical protein
MLPNMPMKPNKRMKVAATAPPNMKAQSMVRGWAKKARSVRTGSKNG